MKSIKGINSGKNVLAEHCRKVSINDVVREVKIKIKNDLLINRVSLLDKYIELVTGKSGSSGQRYWFKCTTCDTRVGVLYIHPISKQIGCRRCLNIEYKSRRYKGMLESRI